MNLFRILTLNILTIHLIQACTIFSTIDENNNSLVARNFDWNQNGMKFWFKPKTQTEYSIFFITQSNDETSPYEGVNEKGLFVAIAAVPTSDTPIRFKRPIKSLKLITEILKYSSNIDEAIKLFDIYLPIFGTFMGYPMVHFKIVQQDGQSVLIEYYDNKMHIINKNSNIMTNHYIGKPELGSDSNSSFNRYSTVKKQINNFPHINSTNNYKILKKVSQSNTVWSNVYNLTNLTVMIKYKNKKPFTINIKKELKSLKTQKVLSLNNFN
jgi:penicillin V acylase-like amidase (Ntn superfamily)